VSFEIRVVILSNANHLLLVRSAQILLDAQNGELFLQRPRRNILAIVRSAEADLLDRFIGALHRLVKTSSYRSNPSHSPTGGKVCIIVLGCARMKHLHSRDFFRVLNPADFFPHFERARIPSRSHHYAKRSIC
jgi:hypothetical protein